MYENIFIIDSNSAWKIDTLLQHQLPLAPCITNIQYSNGIINCSFNNALVNYKKFVGSAMNTAMFLNDPFMANATIQIKYGKYKVTVTNITFNLSLVTLYNTSHLLQPAENIFLKNSNTQFKNRNTIIQAGKYLEQHLTDIFTLKNPTLTDW